MTSSSSRAVHRVAVVDERVGVELERAGRVAELLEGANELAQVVAGEYTVTLVADAHRERGHLHFSLECALDVACVRTDS